MNIKKIDRIKLIRINELINQNYNSKDPTYFSELIHLVYSINPDGQSRNIPLAERLSTFNCGLNINKYEFTTLKDSNILHPLFIIGLFIGDGSLGFVFDE